MFSIIAVIVLFIKTVFFFLKKILPALRFHKEMHLQWYNKKDLQVVPEPERLIDFSMVCGTLALIKVKPNYLTNNLATTLILNW